MDSDSIEERLSYDYLKKAFANKALFKDKTWLISPQAFPLTSAQFKIIESLGKASYEFHRALELLYERSSNDKNLLRNRDLQASWVAEYLDRGKPESLLKYAKSPSILGQMPPIIRPDLLLTDSGFALTEFDSVPGGIGLTAFLNKLYCAESGRSSIIGLDDGEDMIDSFYRVLKAKTPHIKVPYIAIIVSDEAETYLPEMEWIAMELRSRGRRVNVFNPVEVMPFGDAIRVMVDGEPQLVDIIYRFWELFDLSNVPIAKYLLTHNKEDALPVVPPMRPFQEEKLSMALFHHRLLEGFWIENLSRQSFTLLRKVIPETWVVDPVELPPNAFLDAPLVNGNPIESWEKLAEAGKKDRNLILKISGFHERAWGARSVVLGSDCSREDWESALCEAVKMAPKSLYIIQIYKKPKRVTHPVYDNKGGIISMEGRIRLCPYYFVNSEDSYVNLRGVLATLCPANKKIIHGMKDASLIPCIQID